MPAAVAGGAVALVLLIILVLALTGNGDDTDLAQVPPSTDTTAPSTTTTVPSTTTSRATTTTAQTTSTTAEPGPRVTSRAEAQLFMVSKGYLPTSGNGYDDDNTLNVLVGSRPGGGQLAFFFADDRALGTDTSSPSASIDLVDQSSDTVTLAYAVYDGTSAQPTGKVPVRYRYDGAKVTPLDAIPSRRNPA